MLPFDFIGLTNILKRTRKVVETALREELDPWPHFLHREDPAERGEARACEASSRTPPEKPPPADREPEGEARRRRLDRGDLHSRTHVHEPERIRPQRGRRAGAQEGPEILSYSPECTPRRLRGTSYRSISCPHAPRSRDQGHPVDSRDKVIFTSNPEVERCSELRFRGASGKPRARGGNHAPRDEADPLRLEPRRGSPPVPEPDGAREGDPGIADVHHPIVVSGFLLMALLGVVALHTPFRVLKRLTVEAKLIGEGDLSRRVPAEGNDEAADFCKAFNEMVDGLARARQTILRSHLGDHPGHDQSWKRRTGTRRATACRSRFTPGGSSRMSGVSPEDAALIETAPSSTTWGRSAFRCGSPQGAPAFNKEEIEIVRQHVLIGEKILLHMDSMKDVARWVRHHHEMGRPGIPGWPARGGDPPRGRIIGVADALDAMLTDRPYRKALSPKKAAEELIEGAGNAIRSRNRGPCDRVHRDEGEGCHQRAYA